MIYILISASEKGRYWIKKVLCCIIHLIVVIQSMWHKRATKEIKLGRMNNGFNANIFFGTQWNAIYKESYAIL